MTIEAAYHNALQNLSQKTSGDYAEIAAAVRIVMDHIVGVSHAHLRCAQKVLSPVQISQYHADVRQLAEGVPVPYILGAWEFYGREFICDARALIPRPETEILVECVINHVKKYHENTSKVLLADLGCGSGCIAVSIACELPQALIIATDISEEALALAQENAAKHSVTNRIQFVLGTQNDWGAPLSKVLSSNDLLHGIVTNPPYIPLASRPTLQTSVRDYEPDAALFGGADGLDEYRHLAQQCRSFLQPNGYLWAELGAGQFDAARVIYQNAGWHVAPPILDIAGIKRVLCASL